MCIHELSRCAWCHAEEEAKISAEVALTTMETLFAQALQESPTLPPHTAHVVPVPTTSRHEPDHDPRVEWDPHRHRIGSNVYPTFVPVEDPGDVEVLFARLAQARPDWVSA